MDHNADFHLYYQQEHYLIPRM